MSGGFYFVGVVDHLSFKVILHQFWVKKIFPWKFNLELINVYQSLDDEELAVFPTKRRNIEHMVCRRCDISFKHSEGWTQNGANDCLDFTTNLVCIILGVNVFGSNTYSGKHDISLNISNSSDVLRSIETVLYSEEGQKIYPVMFGKPLHVKKDTRYTIQLNMKGPEAFIGKSYKAIVSLNKLSITFLNSSLPSPNMTNGMGGQIPGIIIQHI
jgi:hypothetical protein